MLAPGQTRRAPSRGRRAQPQEGEPEDRPKPPRRDRRRPRAAEGSSGEPSAETDGGVILCGEIYDIDLSIGSIVDEVFANNEKAISDKLFGEGAGV